jgi:hypothetical protein
MDAKPQAEWAMAVVMVCHVTPPKEVLRKTVDEVCGRGSDIAYDNERPVITIDAEASDSEEAVAVLNSKSQELVRRLAEFDCSIESTTRLENRDHPLETSEAASLGEGSQDR